MPEEKDCGRKHGYPSGQEEVKKSKAVTDAELDEIIDRLYTQSVKRNEEKEKDKDKDDEKKEGKSDKEVQAIVDRLYETKTKAMENDPSQRAVAEDKISKKQVTHSELDNIVDRLYTTHTASSSSDNKPRRPNTHNIAKQGLSEDEIKEIYDRLVKTHTKSSAGGAECKTVDPAKTPGLGLKMLPIIEGLDERFKGKQLSDDQAKEIMQRLLTTQTSASQARKDFPKILLYPERTILHNCTERIRAYQDSGTMSRQKELERREKWFN